MNFVFALLFTLLNFYVAMLAWLAYGFLRSRSLRKLKNLPPTPLSIIICARNEEKHIARCLQGIMEQDYPAELIELILVNDASSDGTLAIAQSLLQKAKFSYRILSNSTQQGKKASITSALSLSLHPLIILRDADTYTSSSQWLKSVSAIQQASAADLIIGPVTVTGSGRPLAALQAIESDILSVMACGGAWYKLPFLASAANLAFTKSVFQKVNGFTSHLHINTGDDIFFMEDIRKVPHKGIVYLKSTSAMVYTYPLGSLFALFRQKMRWSSKVKSNTNPLNRLLAFLVFAVNLGFIGCLFGFIFNVNVRTEAGLFMLCKLVIDLLLLFLASSFTGHRRLLFYALPLGLIYPFYAMITGIGALVYNPLKR